MITDPYDAYQARLDWIDTRARNLAVEYAEEFNATGTIAAHVDYQTFLQYSRDPQTLREYFIETMQQTVDETAEQIIARLALEAARREFDSEEI